MNNLGFIGERDKLGRFKTPPMLATKLVSIFIELCIVFILVFALTFIFFYFYLLQKDNEFLSKAIRTCRFDYPVMQVK